MSANETPIVPPVLEIRRSTLEWVLEALAASAVIYGLVLLIPYADIPDKIPSHFGASGEADAWGSKSLLLLLTGINVALYVGLTVLSRFPHKFNYPWPITEENARRQYELARMLMCVLKVATAGIFTYISHMTLETAAGNAQGLGTGFLPAILFGTFVPIAVYLLFAHRAR